MRRQKNTRLEGTTSRGMRLNNIQIEKKQANLPIVPNLIEAISRRSEVEETYVCWIQVQLAIVTDQAYLDLEKYESARNEKKLEPQKCKHFFR
jgi:hypothetical protein